jgi:hypothetical protein
MMMAAVILGRWKMVVAMAVVDQVIKRGNAWLNEKDVTLMDTLIMRS